MVYRELKISNISDFKALLAEGKIKVLNYLPVKEKRDFLNFVVNNAIEKDGLFNPIMVDEYFDMGLIISYTDISFSIEDMINLDDIYDDFVKSGILSYVKQELISKDEFEYLNDCLSSYIESIEINARSIGGLFSNLSTNLPENVEKAAQIIESFDKEKYASAVEFANALNGGRNFQTNAPIED